MYFTKYLPVEGEIKAGDGHFKTKFVAGLSEVSEKEYYANGGDEINPTGKVEGDRIYIKDQGSWYHKGECQKVKLFLCSRDIQVGDKAYFNTTSDPVEVTKVENGMLTNKGGKTYSVDESFKVIGEISPNASWVTEGMEFDENDVEKWITHVNTLQEREIIKVRCPHCKVFN